MLGCAGKGESAGGREGVVVLLRASTVNGGIYLSTAEYNTDAGPVVLSFV